MIVFLIIIHYMFYFCKITIFIELQTEISRILGFSRQNVPFVIAKTNPIKAAKTAFFLDLLFPPPYPLLHHHHRPLF